MVLELREVDAADRGFDDRRSPSFRRFAGIHAVATYSPGGVGRCHRSSVSIALNAIAASAIEHLDLREDAACPSRSTRNTTSIPIGSRTSTTPGGIPSCGSDANREDPRRDRRRAPSSGSTSAPIPRCASGGGSSAMTSARGPSSTTRPPSIWIARSQSCATAGSLCETKTHRAARAAELLHAAEAPPLELGVADREHLVDEQDLRLEMGGDRERQPHVHAARVALHRRVDELLDPGELDDRVVARGRSRGASFRGSRRSE